MNVKYAGVAVRLGRAAMPVTLSECPSSVTALQDKHMMISSNTGAVSGHTMIEVQLSHGNIQITQDAANL